MNAGLRRALWLGLLILGLLGPWPWRSGAAQTPALPAATQPAAPAGTGLTGLPLGTKVAVLPVEGIIYEFTYQSIKRRTEQAIAAGATLIVIELDTPGGYVDWALRISQHLKALKVPTLAWVNPQAYSAGAMIAASCNGIVMSPSSVTGDAAPVELFGRMDDTMRMKVLSAILENFRDSARRAGYDYSLFHAMCELGVEVYQIRHKTTGAVRLVNQVDYQYMVRGLAPEGAGPLFGGATTRAGTVDARRVSYEAAEAEDIGKWELVRKVHDGKSLLTLSQTRAYEIGLCRNDPAHQPIRDAQELGKFIQAASVDTVSQVWIEGIAFWLTRPWARAILLVIALLGAFIELNHPGLGVAGAVSVLALLLLLGAPYLVGMAQIWHLVLFFVGFVMLMIELFVTPGFGALGIVGIILMFVGLVLAVVPTASGSGGFSLPGREMAAQLQMSVLWTILGVIGSGVGLYFLTRYFGSIPVLNKLVLRSPRRPAAAGAEGGAAALEAQALPASGDEAIGEGRVHVGDAGQALSELKPTGRARLGGQVVDVISQGDWVEPGRKVRVVEVRGNLIFVDTVD